MKPKTPERKRRRPAAATTDEPPATMPRTDVGPRSPEPESPIGGSDIEPAGSPIEEPPVAPDAIEDLRLRVQQSAERIFNQAGRQLRIEPITTVPQAEPTAEVSDPIEEPTAEVSAPIEEPPAGASASIAEPSAEASIAEPSASASIAEPSASASNAEPSASHDGRVQAPQTPAGLLPPPPQPKPKQPMQPSQAAQMRLMMRFIQTSTDAAALAQLIHAIRERIEEIP